MKAEHRKELETNTLAEGVGQFVRKMKDRPRRSTFGYAAAGVAFLIILMLVWRWFHVNRMENADRWFLFENGTKSYLDKLVVTAPDSTAGKAALLERSWILLWEEAMKGIAQKDGINRLDAAYKAYDDAVKQCQGDPTFEPEALFAMAVIEESKALIDRKYLDSAENHYQKVADSYKDSAFGKQAGERLLTFKDKTKRAELVQFYQNLSEQLGIQRIGPGAADKLFPHKNLKLPPLPPDDGK